MTQEDKELLLKDLCARLPYETKVYWANCNYGDKVKNLVSIDEFGMVNDEFPVEECKPFLRPMSSMTEEEKDYVVKHSLGYTANIGGGKKDEKLYFHFKAETYDWLNKNMFDFRGLIPKGFAIKITKENNPYKD